MEGVVFLGRANDHYVQVLSAAIALASPKKHFVHASRPGGLRILKWLSCFGTDRDTQALVGTLRLIAPTKTLLLTAVRIYLKEYGRKVGPRKSKSVIEQIPQAE